MKKIFTHRNDLLKGFSYTPFTCSILHINVKRMYSKLNVTNPISKVIPVNLYAETDEILFNTEESKIIPAEKVTIMEAKIPNIATYSLFN